MTEARVPEVAPGEATERRIGSLTLIIGLTAAAMTAGFGQRRWAMGLAIGTLLGWLNFRWLRRGLDAFLAVSKAQEGREKPQIPLATYFTALFRYGLLALAVYAIFEGLHVPLGSMIVGLCALAAATIAASLYEILRPLD
jgi:small-conductance mechanosensitive channel